MSALRGRTLTAYEDVAITRALGMTLSPETIVQTKWDDWGKANKDLVYEVGLMQRLTPEQEANGERSLRQYDHISKGPQRSDRPSYMPSQKLLMERN
jgi:hypothetical protein